MSPFEIPKRMMMSWFMILTPHYTQRYATQRHATHWHLVVARTLGLMVGRVGTGVGTVTFVMGASAEATAHRIPRTRTNPLSWFCIISCWVLHRIPRTRTNPLSWYYIVSCWVLSLMNLKQTENVPCSICQKIVQRMIQHCSNVSAIWRSIDDDGTFTASIFAPWCST